MLGLVAIIAHDRRAVVDQNEIDELATVYRGLRGGSVRRRAAAGAFGQAIELNIEPATDDTPALGSSWVMTIGIPHRNPTLQPRDLERLDGQFAWIAYDHDADEVTVATDPFGMFAVYVAHRNAKTYVATSALVLAKHLHAPPSRLGIELFLRAGWHFGRSTNFEGVERLDPGSRIVFGDAGLRYETYWRPEVDPTVAKMKLDEAVRYCSSVASDTYSRVLGQYERPWVDLTGGFDTRLLALFLRSAGMDFRTTTTGDDSNPDVRIARRLAELGGWEWLQLTLPDDWDQVILPLISTSLAWSDGQLDALYVTRVLWAHREKSRLNRSLMIGGGGEHFRFYAWQHEPLTAARSNRLNIKNWVDLRLLYPMDTSLFTRDPTDKVRADIAARMMAWISPFSLERAATQLDLMYAYKSTGHFGAYLSAAGAFMEPQLPFYFRPVFLAAFSTDPQLRNYHRLNRKIIAALDRRIAAVETVIGGPAEPLRLSNLHRFVPYYREFGRRGVNKLAQKVGLNVFAAQKAPDRRLVSARRAVLEQVSKEGGLTAAKMRAGPLFKPTALAGLVERAARPDFAQAELLGRIITVELALEAADASLDE